MDLPTYTNIWRIEKRLYKLYDLRLPMPLPLVQIGVFVGVFLPWIILLQIAQVPFHAPWHVVYIVPPGVLTWLATRPVIEGKRLTELLISQVRYLTEAKTWARLTPIREPDEVVVVGRVWRRHRGVSGRVHAGRKGGRRADPAPVAVTQADQSAPPLQEYEAARAAAQGAAPASTGRVPEARRAAASSSRARAQQRPSLRPTPHEGTSAVSPTGTPARRPRERSRARPGGGDPWATRVDEPRVLPSDDPNATRVDSARPQTARAASDDPTVTRPEGVRRESFAAPQRVRGYPAPRPAEDGTPGEQEGTSSRERPAGRPAGGPGSSDPARWPGRRRSASHEPEIPAPGQGAPGLPPARPARPGAPVTPERSGAPAASGAGEPSDAREWPRPTGGPGEPERSGAPAEPGSGEGPDAATREWPRPVSGPPAAESPRDHDQPSLPGSSRPEDASQDGSGEPEPTGSRESAGSGEGESPSSGRDVIAGRRAAPSWPSSSGEEEEPERSGEDAGRTSDDGEQDDGRPAAPVIRLLPGGRHAKPGGHATPGGRPPAAHEPPAATTGPARPSDREEPAASDPSGAEGNVIRLNSGEATDRRTDGEAGTAGSSETTVGATDAGAAEIDTDRARGAEGGAESASGAEGGASLRGSADGGAAAGGAGSVAGRSSGAGRSSDDLVAEARTDQIVWPARGPRDASRRGTEGTREPTTPASSPQGPPPGPFARRGGQVRGRSHGEGPAAREPRSAARRPGQEPGRWPQPSSPEGRPSGQEPGAESAPGSATGSGRPSEPSRPNMPGAPSTSPALGTPATSDTRGASATSAAPHTSGTPGERSARSRPSAPGTPDTPGIAGTPGTPGGPAAPGTSGAPRTPGAPGTGTPGGSGGRGGSEAPGSPGTPGGSRAPGTSRTPGSSGASGGPGTPGGPGKPGQAPAARLTPPPQVRRSPGTPSSPASPPASSPGTPPAAAPSPGVPARPGTGRPGAPGRTDGPARPGTRPGAPRGWEQGGTPAESPARGVRSGPASPVRPGPLPQAPDQDDRDDDGRGLRRIFSGGGSGEADYEQRVRTAFDGARRVVVLGCTGGAGQTVTGLMLGHTFAQHRGDRIVAVDVNPGPGAMARRTRTETRETLTSLITHAEQITGYQMMRRYTSVSKSGLEVVAAGKNPVQALDDRDYALAMRTLDRFYAVTLLDAAAAVVARVLPYADQIVLVAPASSDAPRAVAMTFEWLDGHGYEDLRAKAVTVINGVSRRSMDDVEQAESVARGRCRALVRIPWDDHLSLDRAPRNELRALRSSTRKAYIALGGVVAGGFVQVPDRYSQQEFSR